MNLRRLEYFVVLAKELHFGRAAERLHLAQPGLSQQIKLFEKECGATLFERTASGVRLTNAGRILLDDGPGLLGQVEHTAARVRAAGRGHTGALRAVLTRSVAFGLPDRIISTFRDCYPDVDIATDVAWTARNVDMLRAAEVDVAFVRLPLLDAEDLSVITLGHTEAVVACPVGHPLAAKHRVARTDLRNETLISWPRLQAPGYFDEMHRVIFGDAPPSTVLWEPDPERLLAAVDAGRGVAVVDAERASTLRSRGVKIRRFAAPIPLFEFGVAWNPRWENPIVSVFLDVCRDMAI